MLSWYPRVSLSVVNTNNIAAFNALGVVEVTEQDTHNVVNVEFHDRSARKAYHFKDTYKYDMASLGERGILYSCGPENGHPARIEYKPYSSWAVTTEWTFEFPDGEYPLALAAGGQPSTTSLRVASEENVEGNGVAVVATNRGFLRFFTGGGLQSYIWTIAEDVICMVAGREWVFVVFRAGGTTLDGNTSTSAKQKSDTNFGQVVKICNTPLFLWIRSALCKRAACRCERGER